MQGAVTVRPDTLVLHSLPPSFPAIYNAKDVNDLEKYDNSNAVTKSTKLNVIDPLKLKKQLKKVEEGQKKFQTNN